MDMIINNANAFWNATKVTDNSTEIPMQTIQPFVADVRHAVFGAENNVIMQAQMG